MSLRRLSSSSAMFPETGHAVGSERPKGGTSGTTHVLHGAACQGWQPKRGCCALQGQPLGLPGKRRFAHCNTRTFVSSCSLPLLFQFICKALDHWFSLKGLNMNLMRFSHRVHWALWEGSRVGGLQEEPQRRHTPTENPQDLHCKCFQESFDMRSLRKTNHLSSINQRFFSFMSEGRQNMWKPLSHLSRQQCHHSPSGQLQDNVFDANFHCIRF